MKILAISGSLKANSVNTAVLQAMEKLAPVDIDFNWYSGIGDLPHFNPDLDKEGMPVAAPVKLWRNTLKAADAVIICTPEYALGIPGVLKNALDWIVSSGEFVNKPIGIISASPMDSGGNKAHASLRLTLGMMGAKIVEGASLTIPFIKTKMSAEGVVSHQELILALNSVLMALIAAI